MMTMKFAALAAAAIAMPPFAAFAQSAPAPINQTGPGVTAPVSSPTDMGIAAESGNLHGRWGGAYAMQPRAAVVSPGYGSYAAVPNSGYYAAPGYSAYGAYRGAYSGYAGPSDGYTYFDED